MMRRFYSSDIPESGEFDLDQIQSNHISSVLRAKEGESVSVFDGRGGEFACTITRVSKKTVTLAIDEEIPPRCAESPLKLVLAVPLLKGNKSDLIVHKAVELGVTEIAPFQSLRSEVPLKKWKTERALRIAVEASKQCGRATLPLIREAVRFPELVETLDYRGVLFYEEDSEAGIFAGTTDKIFLVTGPEGGFEPEEIELARTAGFEIAHFGGRILKAETAAIVATALVQHHYGDY